MSNSKQFFQALREGEVKSVTLRDENTSDRINLFWHTREGECYLMLRTWPSFSSALKYVLKALDKPIVPGLIDHYQRPPLVEIVKLKRRPNHEKNQHEQALKPPELP